MQTLTERMGEDMRLRGLALKTQQAYRGAVAALAKHFARSPDTLETLTEAELRVLFLELVTTRQVSRSTLIVYRSGIRFLYEVTLQRSWPVFDLVRPAKRHTLPNVLAVAEVHQLLMAVRDAQARMTLTLIYSCGLRLSEGITLRTSDIDRARMVIHVRAVRRAALGERLAHVRHQHLVDDRAPARGPLEVRIEAGHRDLEDAAHESHGKLAAMASEHGAPHRDSFAKYAATFLRTRSLAPRRPPKIPHLWPPQTPPAGVRE